MLFVGDDWAEDHHDVEIVDQAGRRLVRRRVDEGAGLAALHALIGDHLDPDAEPIRCWWGSRPTAARGCRHCSLRAMWSTRSTRCRPPATGNATEPRARRALQSDSPRAPLSHGANGGTTLSRREVASGFWWLNNAARNAAGVAVLGPARLPPHGAPLGDQPDRIAIAAP